MVEHQQIGHAHLNAHDAPCLSRVYATQRFFVVVAGHILTAARLIDGAQRRVHVLVSISVACLHFFQHLVCTLQCFEGLVAVSIVETDVQLCGIVPFQVVVILVKITQFLAHDVERGVNFFFPVKFNETLV